MSFSRYDKDTTDIIVQDSLITVNWNFTLLRQDRTNNIQIWSNESDYNIEENIEDIEDWMTNSELNEKLAELESRFPSIVEFHHGENDISIKIQYITITSEVILPNSILKYNYTFLNQGSKKYFILLTITLVLNFIFPSKLFFHNHNIIKFIMHFYFY